MLEIFVSSSKRFINLTIYNMVREINISLTKKHLKETVRRERKVIWK